MKRSLFRRAGRRIWNALRDNVHWNLDALLYVLIMTGTGAMAYIGHEWPVNLRPWVGTAVVALTAWKAKRSGPWKKTGKPDSNGLPNPSV